MKKILYIIILAMFLFACNENSTDPKNENIAEIQKFKSHNVKTNGKHFFTFSTNSAETNETINYDIAFGTVPLTVESAPCQYFTMPNDPVILCGPNSSIAIIDAVSLSDINSIPAESEFAKDDILGEAYIGKNWYDSNNEVKNEIYIIKTCAGNFALLEIKNYNYDFITHQISSIHFSYKYNASISLDFSSTPIDSFKSENAYSEAKYFSFENGNVNSTDSYHLKIAGSSIWLGNNVKVKKIENTSIENISIISDSEFQSDKNQNYVTLGWYSYGEGHLLTPKDYVYVVKTIDGKYTALEINNYYDDEGNSGTFSIDWKYLN
ncbi:MAG: HmuY family protein [Ignavibacteriae bacterium]|nr:HmuY family protein [Ignavibacteriota bacterium]